MRGPAENIPVCPRNSGRNGEAPGCISYMDAPTYLGGWCGVGWAGRFRFRRLYGRPGFLETILGGNGPPDPPCPAYPRSCEMARHRPLRRLAWPYYGPS